MPDRVRACVEVGLVDAVAYARGESAGLNDPFPELKRQAALMLVDAVREVRLQRYDHAGDATYATGVAIRFTD
ncbi:MAG: hypothetical protein MJE66_01995 [Proteobacteria bacterium]|nr:hypothetical protein [Pseudomonadota bacterium]